jgi:signal-transduction protein with cAMP-binding, CBS, and nucleotidyltransferase domain
LLPPPGLGRAFEIPVPLQALQMMRDRKIRAVLVIDDTAQQGIGSQGDCAIKVLLSGRNAANTRLDEIMTRGPLTVGHADTLDHCMRTMMARHIRHLPVQEDGRVVGMVSIGDIVKDIMAQQGQHIRYLETYIKGHSGEY